MTKMFLGRTCPNCGAMDITLLLNMNICNRCNPPEGLSVQNSIDSSQKVYTIINVQFFGKPFPSLGEIISFQRSNIIYLVTHITLESARKDQQTIKTQYSTDCLLFEYIVQENDKRDKHEYNLFSSKGAIELYPAKWPVALTAIE